MQRWKRLARMIDLINRGRCPTRDQFCREFECKLRTVDEDIRFLREDMQLPIKFDQFKGGYINENPNQKLPEFDLDFAEVFALALGKEMLAEYSGTSLEPILQSALDKIADRLPQNFRVKPADLVSSVRFKPAGVAPITRKQLFEFAEACDAQRVVSINYYSASTGEHTRREIEPISLIENRGAWYCIAWCRLRNEVRMFAMHRVEQYKVLDETFVERDDVDVDALLQSAFLLEHGDPPQRYVVWFDDSSAQYVRERQWQDSQEITEHLDGSLTISFTATRLDEVCRWVLGYGGAAQVIEPPELRERVRQEAARIVANYAQDVQLRLPVAAQTPRPSKKQKVSGYHSDSNGESSI